MTTSHGAAASPQEAHRAFARMRLPEAETVRRIAERHGLTLVLADPD